MPPESDVTAAFEAQRRHLRALAYRMLASRAEAEDVVQDCWLRWREVDHATVRDTRAYLSQTATHLCLDRLQSARQRRERYVGVWLPEPLVDEGAQYSPDPEAINEYAQNVSIAFMLALERLSALERAAFLLHDVFDVDFDEIGRRLQRSAAACRQLATRARQHVRANEVRNEVAEADAQRLMQAFGMAIARGDVDALADALTADAEFLSDGGGIVAAVPKPIHGSQRIAKTLIGFARQADWTRVRIEPARINGWPGGVLYDQDGTAIQTLTLRFAADGRIASIYVTRNPFKLAHLHRHDP
ncbi:MAG TPA: RNA polymerase sigma factor SigJ [Ramlibacter sp.]|nr:RNA polymerase sigma factor SigJ [Ramlibacter sp.]